MTVKTNANHHLQSHLAHLDIRIHRAIQQMQRAETTAPQNVFEAISLSPEQAYDLLQRPFGQVPVSEEEPEIDEAEYLQALAQVEAQITEQVAEAEERGELLPLHYLAAVFGLDRFALDSLLICLAPDLDLRYEKLYGYLLDDLTRKRPTVNLILDLLAEVGPQRLNWLPYFSEESPLFKFDLLEPIAEPGIHQPPLLNQALRVDPTVVAWLMGIYEPRSVLRPYLTFNTQLQPERNLLATEQQEVLAGITDGDAIIACYGRDSTAQAIAAQLLTAQWEQPLLTLDLARALKADLVAQEVIDLTLRDARLLFATVHIEGWDAGLADGIAPEKLLATICDYPGPVILASATQWQAQQRQRDRHLHWLEFPMPSVEQRQQILTHLLQAHCAVESLAVETVAGQFVLTTGQLRAIVDTALDQGDQAKRPLESDDLFAAARAHSSPNLGMLARKLGARYDWADLVLPTNQREKLSEFVSRVQQRPLVLKRWGVGEKLAPSYGLSALFAGPPGTGKTMAAEVMARAIKLDIYKIDLSSMVSKYIGETEKNLERIFSEAENSNAILFFDEADAIFGKRSEVKDAHDRYANIEVSYLLQRMEMYDGVTILATNLRANLDEAFTRRFDAIVDFPFPEESERLRIWQTLFPPNVPRAALDLPRMARSFKLAGGNIANIIMGATYLAAANGQVVTMNHLLHSTRRELQKMGRLVNEQDFEV